VSIRFVLATANPDKAAEIAGILEGVDLVPRPADVPEVEETGATLEENALLKARALMSATGEPAVADDTGLEVDALDGAPGLYSARYSPKPNATDKDRRLYLLQNLKDKPRPWTARFHATIAIVTPNNQLQVTEGFCEGEIIPEERGTGGFGYDPIFLLPELGKTMAELSMDEKNRLSHRARAVMKAKPVLRKLFTE
jgi:XTP/dITP diphosphohydrolase